MELITTMIIDDEIRAIHYLKNLIDWESCGFHIIAAETSVKAAVQSFDYYKPQLVITDICMPDMDGLKLCDVLKEKYNNVTIVFLTAHKNFEYAKSAVEIGAAEYLMKHELRPGLLIDKLNKIRMKIESSQSEVQLHRKSALAQAILGISNDTMLTDEIRKSETKGRMYFMCFIVSRKNFYLHNTYEQKPDMLEMDGFSEKWAQVENDFGRRVEYVDEVIIKGMYYLFIFSFNRIQSEQVKRQVSAQAAAKVKSIADDLLKTETVCIAGLEEQNRCSLEKMYNDSLNLLRHSVFVPEAATIVMDEHYRNLLQRKRNDYNYQELELKLTELLEKGKPEELNKVLKALFFEDLYRNASIFDVELCCDTVKRILLRFIDKRGAADHIEKDKFIKQWCGCKTLGEYCEAAISMCNRLFDNQTDSLNQKYSYRMRRAIWFIASNYMKNIGISDIAENLNVSNSYIIKCFKRESNQTFSSFLTDYRIKISKQLLVETDKKIYEIAEQAGFGTSQYFAMVFFKRVGVTPNQYRKQNLDLDEAGDSVKY